MAEALLCTSNLCLFPVPVDADITAGVDGSAHLNEVAPIFQLKSSTHLTISGSEESLGASPKVRNYFCPLSFLLVVT